MTITVSRTTGRHVLRQIAIWLGFLVAYQLVRGLVRGGEGAALEHARQVVQIERAVGLLHERGLQSLLTGLPLVEPLFDWGYWLSQFAVVVLCLTWLFARRRPVFFRLRNLLIASNVAALVVYLLYPTAPPRLVAHLGIADTLAGTALNQGSEIVQLASNPYAAMPSIHAADSLLVAVVMGSAVASRLARVLWLVWPAFVWLAVVVTGNHFLLDVLAGTTLAGAALAIETASARRPPESSRRERLRARATILHLPAREATAPRVLVLTALVGEGHASAARALAEDLSRSPGVEVTVADALVGLGRPLRFVLLDSYRWQIRSAPWLFAAGYRLFLRVSPLRGLGRFGLAALSLRSMPRLIRAFEPDIIVSTFPAATSAIGSLRRTGRLRIPALATVTDFDGIAFWSHRSIDLHLVMHASIATEVEALAGIGSAVVVRPLVRECFFVDRTTKQARAALDLPSERTIVVVSGGGWGVGNLGGAVLTALQLDVDVVCLSGRDEELRVRLCARYEHDPRVRILGFTEEMSDLLTATDVLVHSMGGVTCLEALVRGTPVIAYGAPAGHAGPVAKQMASLGLVQHARSEEELADTLRLAIRGGLPRPQLATAREVAPLVIAARARRRPRRRVSALSAVVAIAARRLIAVPAENLVAEADAE